MDRPPGTWTRGPVRPFSREATIDHWVDRRVLSAPDAPAILYDGGRRSLSYRQLASEANRWSRALTDRGIGPGDAVAFCLERGPRQLAFVLGILKAGAAYVPLDPEHPAARLEQLLEQSGAALLVADGNSADRLPRVSMPLWQLDAAARPPQLGRGQAARRASTAEDLAYILFTSGSTGRPKGIAMPHRPLVNLIAWQLGCWPKEAGARTLQFAPLGFDVSFQEIFSTWCSGGTVMVIDETLRRDPNGLLWWIESLEIERVFLPVVMLRALAEASARRPCQLALRQIITAGEALEITPAIEGFLRRMPACRLTNQYGPTETHVVTSYDVPPQSQVAARRPPIGRPIANVQVHLLDAERRPVACGDVGELYIGGEAVARGYVGDPIQTAERFLDDPDRPAGRIYRTGDFARWLPDGQLQFLGRRDDQVKIRGHRVELGEVQTALHAIRGVRQAAVLADERPNGGHQLWAAAVLDAATTPDAVRQQLASLLPSHCVPARIVPLDALPLTASGKVDRIALRAIARGTGAASRPADSAPRILGSADDAPRSPLELRLLRIWQRVLQQPLGLRDNFFDGGGDSLLAIELLASLEEELKRRVPLAALLDHPTVEAMAAHLEQSADEPLDRSPLIPLQRRGARAPLYCIHPGGGNGLCYLSLAEQLRADRPVYALQAAGLEGRRQPVETVEAMAREYLEAIRSVQPAGPYALAGWSFGGTVAYEMACQLDDQGEPVEPLAVIDAGILYSFGVMRTVFPKREFAMLELRSRSIEAQVAAFRHRTAAAGLIPPRATDAQAERIYRVFLANAKAMMNYRPRPYSGRLTLILGEEPLSGVRHDPAQEWRTLCRHVDLHVVSGCHLTLMREPHVRHVAEVLRECLEQPAGIAAEVGTASATGP